MPKTGAGLTGEAKTGEAAKQVLQAPAQTLALATPPATVSGVGVTSATAPPRVLALDTPPVAISGEGAVTAAAPVRTLTLATPPPNLGSAFFIQAPARTLTLATPPPAVSGVGRADTVSPTQTLAVATPPPTILNVTVQTLSAPTGTLVAETPTPTLATTPVSLAAPQRTLALTTPDANLALPNWLIAGQQIRVVDATLTPTTLTLSIRARTDAELNTLATLDDNAGAVRERARADGTVDGLDTSGGSNTITVAPPSRLSPPRVSRTWIIEDVTRDRTSADTRAVAADLSLINTETRSAATGYSDAADTTKWEFDFAGGRIVTDRVSQIEQGATTQVQLILSPAQAELFETLTAATAGAVVTTVPDGSTFSRDTTPNARQTVTVTPPSAASNPTPAAGTYVITAWESNGVSGGAFRVVMELSTRYEP